MKRKGIILFLIVNLFIFSETESQRNINQTQKIEEQEKQRIEQERVLKEIEEKKKELDNSKLDLPQVEDTGPKFLINHIRLEDDEKLLIKGEEKNLVSKYEGKELGSSDVTKLIIEITNKIISKGYITSAVTISENNDLKTGVLKLIIIPGVIEKVEINEEKFNDKYKEFFTFSTNKGKVLNVRDLDTSTENFTSIRSSGGANMEIAAGKEINTSVIKMTNIMKDRVEISFKGNNHGQSSQSGVWRYGLGLQIDSPFGINDSLILSYMTVNRREEDRSWKKKESELKPGEVMPIGPPSYIPGVSEQLPYKRRTDLVDISYTFPFRTYRFNFSANTSLNEGTLYAFNTVFDTLNATRQLKFGVDKILYRDQKNKIVLDLGITRKRTESYLEETTLSDRTLSIGNIGLSYSTSIFKGLLSASIGYQRGTKLWSAERDGIYKLRENPKAQFDKYVGNLSYYKPIVKGLAFRFNTSFSRTNDVLYGSEKQSMGGPGSIGGYNTSSLSGDNAIETTAEISYTIPLNEWGQLIPYLSYGYGAIKNNYDNSRYGHGYMTGITTGLRYSSKYFNFDLGYGHPDSYSDYIQPKDHELYFSSSFKIIF
ncbi:MAG: ShlB/FhaC/HecB family hemolysin secretion/activation protein [Leptotrichiaceae bacterium]|nr:ShlB/FhaC/HecB family hemolysin secretion/activation protein [Leptotrichiaceae bacterium]MBP9629431.1 ShlB/FhaC/HecB family hemolysin secretion/activation protein [Leptotrichiaceae bacterium]